LLSVVLIVSSPASQQAERVKTSDKNQKAVLDFVKGFVKADDGQWKCIHLGKPCSPRELRSLVLQVQETAAGAALDSLTTSSDGSLRCTTKVGKPCPEAMFRALSNANAGRAQTPAKSNAR